MMKTIKINENAIGSTLVGNANDALRYLDSHRGEYMR